MHQISSYINRRYIKAIQNLFSGLSNEFISKRISFFIAFALVVSLTIRAQNDEVVDSVLNDLFFEEVDLYELFDGNTKYHFLYFVSTFNSATYYAGRQVGDNEYNISGQMYYFISNGLYFGASGVQYSHLDPGFRSVVVSAGYANTLKKFKYLNYRLAYDRYIYVNMGTDFEPTYNSDINVGFTLKNKIIGGRFDYTMLLGNEFGNLLSFDVFSKIKLLSLGTYDRIQFEPQLSWFYGADMVEYDLNAYMVNDPFYEPNYIQKEEFGLLNTQISLPLSVSYRQFDFEVSYSFHFPKSLDPAYYYDKSGFWSISLAYIIDIN
ncbi:MAG: hypothetical protein JW717_03390 [Marinilabiliaceae bacterium]|nr:hypothetical protein [Marinilabiliaceae bacterium]